MGELTATTFLTLDGVMQAPGGPNEDPSGGFAHGGWVVPFADADMGTEIDAIFSRVSAFLLGRTTYDIFAGHWPRVTDPHDPVATKLNGLPKFVASRSLTRFSWQGSEPLGDVRAGVERLTKELPGELQVHGSCGLLQTLIRLDLVDEFRLFVFPVVLGSGKRLFDEGTVPRALKLVSSRTTSTGALISRYRRGKAFEVGSFQLE